MTDTLALAMALIREASVTPDDGCCQTLLMDRLQALNFKIERLPCGNVSNFYARLGTASPCLVFLGHTDVVPPGPLEKWDSPPFEPTIRDGKLYGRGAADMKSSIAAMITACERFIKTDFTGSIAFIITSDEEGPSVDGTQQVVEILKQRGEQFNWALVGEPSSQQKLGDIVKIGRRGSLGGTLTVLGKQGHIAYPHQCENPIHKMASALTELIRTEWDSGYDKFPPTSFQISNIHAGTGAKNVIPGELTIDFNFRYCPAITAERLQQRVMSILQKHDLTFQLEWIHSGKAFLSKTGKLLATVSECIQMLLGHSPVATTTGGTSDARFIIDICPEIVELGPNNESIHQLNEWIRLEELEQLTLLYQKILERLFTPMTT